MIILHLSKSLGPINVMESAYIKSTVQPHGLPEPVGSQAMNAISGHTWSDTEISQSITAEQALCMPSSEEGPSVESKTSMCILIQ